MCKLIEASRVIDGIVYSVPTDANTAHAGMITKIKVSHPHMTDTKIGVMGAKRIICSATGECQSFKTINCFRVPDSNAFAFAHKHEKRAEEHEIRNFIELVKNQAWTNPGKSNAKIKKDWRCSGQDLDAIAGW